MNRPSEIAEHPDYDLDATYLCSCIWSNLGTWEKETAKAISENREGDVSSLEVRAFSARFFSVVKTCGGMDL